MNKFVSKVFGMTECYNKTTAKVQTEQKKQKNKKKNNYYIHVDIEGSSLKHYDPKQTNFYFSEEHKEKHKFAGIQLQFANISSCSFFFFFTHFSAFPFIVNQRCFKSG